MREFSLAENFAIIALNAQESTRLTNSKKVSLRCLAAAAILEIFLDNRLTNKEDSLIFKKEDLNSLNFHQQSVLKALFGKNETLSEALPIFLAKVVKLSKRALEAVEEAYAFTLIREGAMEEIPALINCDLEFITSGISVKEYRSNGEIFTRLTEGLRAEILEEGPLTDETISMLWLLRESGSLYDLFTKEELKHVATRVYELLTNSSLGKLILPIDIHKTVETAVKNFLKIKKEMMSTPSGTGLGYVFPIIERSQFIFIDTEEYFPNNKQRLHNVIDRLKKNGHNVTVIREGNIPLIKIDNILYQAMPHAKNYRIPVHGVRLLKYPLSL
ncbi:hypothetical protein [Bacillus sp. FJAT-49736]|uniref:hypothetical protein n=1 Tax=Bacillus sp. FJAT-49736 TaxID=2833582 RepID=UPI001BC8E164|nr:hypothetical protein [Bacillus sp. FJAT-49736]MBS4175266.1 hypothetical protein [Bacillus sp. FJAT-49736]